ncbi:pentapeptide repeat-containing protein [Oscillatoriales cyanobacterium LEGE 11467]|uniref:Pentapeptide repeat-containing protein n=1 Tax=Zarconia navalis LEGE 11467 TaxID=1828826 RepID=A0A928VZT0_9CYAN|nr:pentapeptide repeat-containing protein [Zarconia navalis LEGE 11467]
MSGANLMEVDWTDTNFSGADFTGAILPNGKTRRGNENFNFGWEETARGDWFTEIGKYPKILPTAIDLSMRFHGRATPLVAKW